MKRLAISLLLLSTLAMGCASTSMQAVEKVKVAGAELEQWLSTYHSYAGTDDKSNCVFIVINHSADRRVQYYDCPTLSGIGKGTARVVGDKMCTKWDYGTMMEKCSEVYRIGENRYEKNNGMVKFYKLK